MDITKQRIRACEGGNVRSQSGPNRRANQPPRPPIPAFVLRRAAVPTKGRLADWVRQNLGVDPGRDRDDILGVIADMLKLHGAVQVYTATQLVSLPGSGPHERVLVRLGDYFIGHIEDPS